MERDQQESGSIISGMVIEGDPAIERRGDKVGKWGRWGCSPCDNFLGGKEEALPLNWCGVCKQQEGEAGSATEHGTISFSKPGGGLGTGE